jgi:hypothetical protein
MIIGAQNKLDLYEPLEGDGLVEPCVLLITHEVTFITNRFHVWSRMLATHPRLAAMSEESKSAHLDIVANWRTTISEATQGSLAPFVVLPEKQYKRAMLLLHVTCQMEADIHKVIG